MSDVISRSPDLRRCQLSHTVLSAFCLIFVSFLQALRLGGFGKLWSSLGAAVRHEHHASRGCDQRCGHFSIEAGRRYFALHHGY